MPMIRWLVRKSNVEYNVNAFIFVLPSPNLFVYVVQ